MWFNLYLSCLRFIGLLDILGMFSAIISSDIASASFFLFSCFETPIAHIRTFEHVSHIFIMFSPFNLFLTCASIGIFSIIMSLSILILSSDVSSLMISSPSEVLIIDAVFFCPLVLHNFKLVQCQIAFLNYGHLLRKCISSSSVRSDLVFIIMKIRKNK